MERVEKIARLLCKLDGHDPNGGPKWGFGWINYEDNARQVLAALSPQREDTGTGERWRHVKRGTVYEVVGNAELQSGPELYDGAALVVYRGDDGKLWAREESEFLDGRFVRLPPAPTEGVARALPTREEIARVIHDAIENDDDSGGGAYLRAADAILALIEGRSA